jgi:hypothetical protein
MVDEEAVKAGLEKEVDRVLRELTQRFTERKRATLKPPLSLLFAVLYRNPPCLITVIMGI